MIDEKMFTVRNVQNGGVYVIGESKMKSEPGEWEMFIADSTVDSVDVKDHKPTVKYTPKKA